MKATRIDHVALVVHDIAAAARRFSEGFGMEIVSDGTVPDGTLRMVYLRAGESLLQLISPIGPGPFADFLAEKGEGLHHLCFEMPSIGNGELSTDEALLPIATGGMGARVRFLAAPVHGASIELTEQMPR